MTEVLDGGFDKVTKNNVFFWGGVFSNWYPSPFKAKSFNGALIELEFNCQEQYMMFNKAMAFADLAAATDIMNESSPQKQKAIGRKVRNFNETHWEQYRWGLTMAGIYSKFLQNPDLYTILMSTGDREIVEASPYDDIWGIGMGSEDPNLLDRARWGQNLLGKQLTHARNWLRDTEQNKARRNVN